MREAIRDRRRAGADGELVAAAAAGDPAAWDALVDRHAGLVWSVCRRFRLSDSDTQDVSQTVWLRLVERLDTLRDPDAVAGWLATSARNECIALWRARRRQTPVSPDIAADLVGLDRDGDAPPVDHDLLTQERHRALRAAVAGLPGHCQALLALLFAEPPLSYEEIGARLAVSRGYIGPTRARCLDKLRSCPALMAYLRLEAERGVDQQLPHQDTPHQDTPHRDTEEAAHLPRVEPPRTVVSSPSPLTSGTTPPGSPRSLLGGRRTVSSSSVANQLTSVPREM